MKLTGLIVALAFGVQPCSVAQGYDAGKGHSAGCNADSLLSRHFAGIAGKLGAKQQLSREEVNVIILLEYLSGLRIIDNIDYAGTIYMSNNSLLNARQWYEKNKHRVDCQKVTHGLALLQKPDVTYAEEQELKALQMD